MRRIGRWMINGLTVLSLGLCVVAVALWVRVDTRRDVLFFTVSGPRLILLMNEDDSLEKGGVCLRTTAHWPVSHELNWTALPPAEDPRVTITSPEYGDRITYPRFFIYGHGRSDWRSTNWHGLELWRGTMYVPLTKDGRPLLSYGPSSRGTLEATPGASRPFLVREVSIPHWMFLVGALLLPTARVVFRVVGPHFFHRGRNAASCCTCDYDLTGNISGVCPECGMAVADRSSKGAASRAEERAPHPPSPGPLP